MIITIRCKSDIARRLGMVGFDDETEAFFVHNYRDAKFDKPCPAIIVTTEDSYYYWPLEPEVFAENLNYLTWENEP